MKYPYYFNINMIVIYIFIGKYAVRTVALKAQYVRFFSKLVYLIRYVLNNVQNAQFLVYS